VIWTLGRPRRIHEGAVSASSTCCWTAATSTTRRRGPR